MTVSLAASTAVFHLDLRTDESVSFAISEQEVVQMEEIGQTQQIEKPAPPPRPPVPIVVPDDVLLDDDVLDFDSILDLDEALAIMPPPAAVQKPEEIEPEIFVVVEDPPKMVGGMAALMAVLKYPDIARNAGLEGTVVVEIVIDENGRPSISRIRKSVHEILDKEAERAIMLQTFIPGKQRGRPVKVYMTIPVEFRLN